MKKKIYLSLIVFLSILIILFFFNELNGNKKTNKLSSSIKNIIPSNFKYLYNHKLDKIYLFYNHKFRKKIILEHTVKNQKINSKNNSYILNKFSNNLFMKNGPKGYLDIHDDKLLLLTGTGILSYTKIDNLEKNKLTLKTINTNLNELISYEFRIERKDFILDLFVLNGDIYLSYLNEIKEGCYNTSILKSKLNYQKIVFKKFFTPSECIKEENKYMEFNFNQSGGALSKFNFQNILLSIGDFRFRDKAQDPDSIFGKILSIDFEGNSKIISMGHRNPQGIYFDKIDNIIYNSEHGPQGGDEINLNFLSNKKIKNFGWPITSYGEHYGGDIEENSHKYEKAPLYKSHKKNGFLEPFKYFVPSIAPTKVIITRPKTGHANNDKYIFLSALGHEVKEGDKSIHIFKVDNNFKIVNYEILPINERIRDMILLEEKNKLILFLESTGSIALVDLKTNL